MTGLLELAERVEVADWHPGHSATIKAKHRAYRKLGCQIAMAVGANWRIDDTSVAIESALAADIGAAIRLVDSRGWFWIVGYGLTKAEEAPYGAQVCTPKFSDPHEVLGEGESHMWASHSLLAAYLRAIHADRTRQTRAHYEALAEEAEKQPTCPYCGTTEGLRVEQPGAPGHKNDAPNTRLGPQLICEDCFKPRDDGPCFDELPPVQEANHV